MCEAVNEATCVRHRKKKIALLFSALRHFAQEPREDGHRVLEELKQLEFSSIMPSPFPGVSGSVPRNKPGYSFKEDALQPRK